jgi:hypothetical protein
MRLLQQRTDAYALCCQANEVGYGSEQCRVNETHWTSVRYRTAPEKRGWNFHVVLLVSIPHCIVEKTNPTYD